MERSLGRAGVTLVEVAAALALLAMVLAAASAILGFGLNTGLRIQAAAYGETVCGQVLDAAAKKLGEELPEGAVYRALSADGKAEADREWRESVYDAELYRGFSLEELSFCLEDPKGHPDVVRIDVVLREERTGNTIMASDYVRLQKYCLYLDVDFGKIGIG